MAADAIPKGGGFADGMRFLTSPDLPARGRDAVEWVFAAIDAVKSAPDNPYGDDDEAVAGEILRRIEEKRSRKA
jgi:hypothetical protein